MKKKFLITFIIGTRPEAIKLASVIKAFNNSDTFDSRVILTGQHKEMVNEILETWEIKPRKNLEIMLPNQTLNYVVSNVIQKLNDELVKFKPDLLVVQGDTSSAFAGALAAFHLGIPIAHVEAGLRTDDINEPFPEEANRRLISQLSTLHFAPTKKSAENLKKDGILERVFITGNTVIDVLLEESKNNFIPQFLKNIDLNNQKLVLATFHRRENWGENIINICGSISEILDKTKDTFFIIPMHKNKIIRDAILNLLSKNPKVILTEPLKYNELISIMKISHFIITDSGGIQEEAPSLGKPVLVLRNKTEREEAIKAGCSKLVGTEKNNIIQECMKLLNDETCYKRMSNISNPFGDGKASSHIFNICKSYLKEKFSA